MAVFLYLKFYACCPSLQVYFSFTDHGIILLLLGLADHDNYHEYCRLLGRFRVNYQVIYCIIIFLKHNLLHVLYFVLLLCIFPCYWFSTHRLVCLDTLTCLQRLPLDVVQLQTCACAWDIFAEICLQFRMMLFNYVHSKNLTAFETQTLLQLSELVNVEGYSDWIQLVAEFTLKSLQSWQVGQCLLPESFKKLAIPGLHDI